MKKCTIENCNEIHKAKGYCNKHYALFKKKGNPISNKRKTLIDINSNTLIKATYNSYYSMIGRCTNKNNARYKDYGLRGIKICEEWLLSFDNFYKDLGCKPTLKHSIERINNDDGYNSINCKWATELEQVYNRRIQHNNTSGVVGVSFDKRWKGCWVSRVNDGNGKRKVIGRFKDKEEAINCINNYKKSDKYIGNLIKK